VIEHLLQDLGRRSVFPSQHSCHWAAEVDAGDVNVIALSLTLTSRFFVAHSIYSISQLFLSHSLCGFCSKQFHWPGYPCGLLVFRYVMSLSYVLCSASVEVTFIRKGF